MWKRNAPYLYVGYCCSDHADMMSSCLMLLNGRVWRCSGCLDVSCHHFTCISVLVEATGNMWSRRCICRHTLRRESKTISCKWPSNSPSQTVSLTCGSMIKTAIVLFSPPFTDSQCRIHGDERQGYGDCAYQPRRRDQQVPFVRDRE